MNKILRNFYLIFDTNTHYVWKLFTRNSNKDCKIQHSFPLLVNAVSNTLSQTYYTTCYSKTLNKVKHRIVKKKCSNDRAFTGAVTQRPCH